MSKTEDLSNMALWLWLWTQKLHPTQTFFLQEAANQNIVGFEKGLPQKVGNYTTSFQMSTKVPHRINKDY